MMTSAATFAYAADPVPASETPIVTPIAAAPVAPFWAGGYVGAQLGYAYSDFGFDNIDLGDASSDGVIGGLNAGYLWNIGGGNWYLGPEIQYDWADLSVSDSDTGASASFDEIGRLKLIVGYELGNGLLYGSGGAAYGKVNGDTKVFDGSETSYVLGLGYDWRVADNWSVGAEYQYHKFKGFGTGDTDIKLNTIHLKAAYRF
jgi:outer membrane immunogenic protein